MEQQQRVTTRRLLDMTIRNITLFLKSQAYKEKKICISIALGKDIINNKEIIKIQFHHSHLFVLYLQLNTLNTSVNVPAMTCKLRRWFEAEYVNANRLLR